MHHPTDRITHTTAFVTPVVEHWLEREIAQWVHAMKDRPDDPSHHDRTLLPRSYISLPLNVNDDALFFCFILFFYLTIIFLYISGKLQLYIFVMHTIVINHRSQIRLGTEPIRRCYSMEITCLVLF